MSAFIFVFPGICRRVKLQFCSFRYHLACRLLSLYSSLKYLRFLWSVYTSNFSTTSNRYCHHLSRASTIASSSLLYISQFLSAGNIVLDRKATGFYLPSCSCERTPPIVCPDASTSILNFSSLLGRASTGCVVIFCFNFSNAFCSSSVHFHSPFPFSRFNGTAMQLKSLINRQ